MASMIFRRYILVIVKENALSPECRYQSWFLPLSILMRIYADTEILPLVVLIFSIDARNIFLVDCHGELVTRSSQPGHAAEQDSSESYKY